MSYANLYSAKLMEFYHKKEFSILLANPMSEFTLVHGSCADKAFTQVLIIDKQLVELCLKVDGCIVAVSCANIFGQWALDNYVSEVYNITEEVLIVNLFGELFSNSRRDCALLGARAVKKALEITMD